MVKHSKTPAATFGEQHALEHAVKCTRGNLGEIFVLRSFHGLLMFVGRLANVLTFACEFRDIATSHKTDNNHGINFAEDRCLKQQQP